MRPLVVLLVRALICLVQTGPLFACTTQKQLLPGKQTLFADARSQFPYQLNNTLLVHVGSNSLLVQLQEFQGDCTTARLTLACTYRLQTNHNHVVMERCLTSRPRISQCCKASLDWWLQVLDLFNEISTWYLSTVLSSCQDASGYCQTEDLRVLSKKNFSFIVIVSLK